MVADKSPTKCRPFPWRCPTCGHTTVVPATIPYTANVKYEGVVHVIEVPALDVPRCQSCGELVFSGNVDEPIFDALRIQLHLLTRAELITGRTRLGLSQAELADRLGVAAQTIADWEEGLSIQPRATDKLLRVFFAFSNVREVLKGKEQDPRLGVLVG